MRNLPTSSTLLLCLALGLPASSWAGLGGTLDSVQSDQSTMKATLKVATQAGYSVHALTLPSGTVVREYATTDGTVFGVVWQGPVKPDLNQILGVSFARIVAAGQAPHASHRMLSVHDSDLVIDSSGKMGSFVGRAYLPALLPANVVPGDIL